MLSKTFKRPTKKVSFFFLLVFGVISDAVWKSYVGRRDNKNKTFACDRLKLYSEANKREDARRHRRTILLLLFHYLFFFFCLPCNECTSRSFVRRRRKNQRMRYNSILFSLFHFIAGIIIIITLTVNVVLLKCEPSNYQRNTFRWMNVWMNWIWMNIEVNPLHIPKHTHTL